MATKCDETILRLLRILADRGRHCRAEQGCEKRQQLRARRKSGVHLTLGKEFSSAIDVGIGFSNLLRSSAECFRRGGASLCFDGAAQKGLPFLLTMALSRSSLGTKAW